MKMESNCHGVVPDAAERVGYKVFWCPFFKRPTYQAGFTGKSGPETWCWCERHRQYARHIDKCDVAGNPTLQREVWIASRESKSRKGDGNGS